MLDRWITFSSLQFRHYSLKNPPLFIYFSYWNDSWPNNEFLFGYKPVIKKITDVMGKKILWEIIQLMFLSRQKAFLRNAFVYFVEAASK